MNKKIWPALIALGVLILAALACATPDVVSGPATAQSVQQTVIAELTQANFQLTPDDSKATQYAAFLQGTVSGAQSAQQQTISAAVAQTVAAGSTSAPPPATITLAPAATEPPAVLPNPSVQPTAAAPTNSATTGSVSGKLCYPASVLPALTIYAKNLGDGAVFKQENPENQSQYTLPGLPEGNYYLFAYTHPGTNNPTSIGIGYTQFVLCGLLASCTDHAMIAVPVNAGETTTDVDICDGYDAGAIPPQP
jgi:hypothetical protein